MWLIIVALALRIKFVAISAAFALLSVTKSSSFSYHTVLLLSWDAVSSKSVISVINSMMDRN